MHCRELDTYSFCYVSSLKACNGIYVMNSVCVCARARIRACCADMFFYAAVFRVYVGRRVTQTSLSSEISSLIVSSWNRFLASFRVSSPDSAVWHFIFQIPVSSASLRYSSSFLCLLPHFLDPCVFYIPLSIVQVPWYSF